MGFILSGVRTEKERIEYMLSKYTEELESLPKGTLTEKNVGNKTYFYLKYREGKKVVSKYILKENVDFYKESLQKRKHLESMIKMLNEELATANKILGGK